MRRKTPSRIKVNKKNKRGNTVQRKTGSKFLLVMLFIPFLGALIGTVVGSMYGDWKMGGFLGIMIGMVISILGQSAFFKKRE